MKLAVVQRFTTRVDVPAVQPCTEAAEMVKFQWLVRQVPVADEINRLAVELVRATRPSDPLASEAVRRYVKFGASVRATMLSDARGQGAGTARRAATTSPRGNLKALALPVLRHRVLTNYQAESQGMSADDVLRSLVAERIA